MSAKTSLAASVQSKKGRLYAVIQIKENGRAKSVWRALGLSEGANQIQVKKAYREVVGAFEDEYNKMLARGGRPAADIPLFQFLCRYLEKAQTYKSAPIRATTR